MAWEPGSGTTDERAGVTTPDELLLHLREAGAKRVFLSRTDAFSGGAIPIVATYAYRTGSPGAGPEAGTAREMLRSVFETIGDRLWFLDRAWTLDWGVEPAFADVRPDLLPLYDRGVERKYGDGFNLRNLLFAYEACRDRDADP